MKFISVCFNSSLSFKKMRPNVNCDRLSICSKFQISKITSIEIQTRGCLKEEIHAKSWSKLRQKYNVNYIKVKLSELKHDKTLHNLLFITDCRPERKPATTIIRSKQTTSQGSECVKYHKHIFIQLQWSHAASVASSQTYCLYAPISVKYVWVRNCPELPAAPHRLLSLSLFLLPESRAELSCEASGTEPGHEPFFVF